MDPKEIVKRKQLAEAERKRLEPILDDAFRLTMPGRKRFTPVYSETFDDIFDETGANAVQEFASRMQAGICPSWTDFVKLEANELVPEKDKRAVNKDLDEIQTFVFEEIWRSNFAQEVSESFLDLSLSTACLLVEDSPQGLVHRSMPMTEMNYEHGSRGDVGGIFRALECKAEQVPVFYPTAELGAELHRIIATKPTDMVKLCEYTKKDYSRKGEQSDNWVIVTHGSSDEQILHRTFEGAGSNPFIPFRWSTAAGEVWARGPLMNALAAVRTTNLMVELLLENAAMALVGMFQSDNEGVVNSDNIQLVPGTILTKEAGTAGLEQIRTPTGNLQFADLLFSDQRMNIKRAMFNDMLADPNKTPATATEVIERTADLAFRSAAGFSRVHYEFVQPYMQRVLYLLEKRGDIELPVTDKRAISFVATSPLAQAQRFREIQTFMQGFQVRSAIWGPQVAASMYDTNKLHPWLIHRFGMMENLYKDTDEVVEALKQQREQMAALTAAANAPGGQPA